MSNLPKLTDLEKDVLDGIYRSEYTDGGTTAAIWTWSIAARNTKKNQLSGVVSSLVKKGIVTTGGNGTRDDDYTVDVTALGIEVARSLRFFIIDSETGHEVFDREHSTWESK